MPASSAGQEASYWARNRGRAVDERGGPGLDPVDGAAQRGERDGDGAPAAGSASVAFQLAEHVVDARRR